MPLVFGRRTPLFCPSPCTRKSHRSWIGSCIKVLGSFSSLILITTSRISFLIFVACLLMMPV